MSEDKGVEEFVGEQEDYRCNSKLERDPVSSSDGVLPGCMDRSSTRALDQSLLVGGSPDRTHRS